MATDIQTPGIKFDFNASLTTPIVTIARRELVLLIFFTNSVFSSAGALDRLIVRKLTLTPIVKTFVEWIPSRFEPKGMKKCYGDGCHTRYEKPCDPPTPRLRDRENATST